MIHELNTGYQPPVIDLANIDKRALFNAFAKSRFMLRKTVHVGREMRTNLEWWNKAERYAQRIGDLSLLRESREKIQRITSWLANEQKTYEKDYVDHILSCAVWIDKVATLDEKAALLGLSTVAARRALKPYAEHNADKSESFTLLLSHMPESHPDPDIEYRVTAAIIKTLMSDPVTHRQTTQHMNEIFGQDVFPLPIVPKPTLVKTDRDGGAA
jgi:hypothetical protein